MICSADWGEVGKLDVCSLGSVGFRLLLFSHPFSRIFEDSSSEEQALLRWRKGVLHLHKSHQSHCGIPSWRPMTRMQSDIPMTLMLHNLVQKIVLHHFGATTNLLL